MTDQRSRKYSSPVVDGVTRAPSRAMLRAVGFNDVDFSKPQIGIASTWAQVTPCNMHIDKLAREAAAGADAAGGKAVIFNTITVSDGISMGIAGHALLAGVARGHRRLHRDRGGRRRLRRPRRHRRLRQEHAGLRHGHGAPEPPVGLRLRRDHPSRRRTSADIVSVFEAVGGHAARHGHQMRNCAKSSARRIPGPGSCGGMYTANTMASAIEALGLSLPNSSAQEAVGDAKREDCRRAGAAVLELLARGIKPSDILTREAFENAITVTIALGGSTNAVLHLLAIADAAGVPLELDDFTRIGARVPVLADLKPSGKYLMSELIAIGGIRPLMKMLLDAGLLHGDCLTVSGRTLAENLADVAPYPAGQDIVRAPGQIPSRPTATWSSCTATSRPDGAVAKITGKEGERFVGIARVFDGRGSRRWTPSSAAASRPATWW